jgi:hypothetical protein
MKKIISVILICVFFQAINIKKLEAQSSIAQAQAVFIYNFTRLIEWPLEYKTGNFVIGIYSSEDVYNEIKKFSSGKMVGSQPITVVKYSSLETIGKCHILFVPYGKTKELKSILGVLGGYKTIIVTEKKGALEEGAVINFVIVEDKLKFELKGSNATKNGLKIHSNLENMAFAKY